MAFVSPTIFGLPIRVKFTLPFFLIAAPLEPPAAPADVLAFS